MLNVERWTLILLPLVALQACASPPSLLPLLRIADKAIAQETTLLDTDAARATAWLNQQRDDLTDAYKADLAERNTLDPDWVLSATATYSAARESLLRHELSLDRQHEIRRDNLAAASQALQRAIHLTELQDNLFADIPDLRRWLLTPSPSTGSQ